MGKVLPFSRLPTPTHIKGLSLGIINLSPFTLVVITSKSFEAERSPRGARPRDRRTGRATGAGPRRGGRRRPPHLPAVDAGRALDQQGRFDEVHGGFAVVKGNADLVQLRNTEKKEN